MADLALNDLLARAQTQLPWDESLHTSDPSDDVSVRSIEHDSRSVQPGSLFACISGGTFDGHDYAAQAVESGAVAVLAERSLTLPATIPQIVVADVRRTVPWLAHVLSGEPSSRLAIVGITGTNGKTTTAQLVTAICRHAGRHAEVLGTLTGVRTTPEAPELQRTLADFVADDVDIVTMEVSSHALDQHRADAVQFAVALFTNLTPDHLDYHLDMDNYFEAKARLFDGRAGNAVINVDDPYGAQLAARVPGAIELSRRNLKITEQHVDRSVFEWRGETVTLPLAGPFNVDNAHAAAETAILLGFMPAQIAAGLSAVDQVPGRVEIVPGPPGSPLVVVDYSHTPDSIEKVLAALRPLVPSGGSLAIVFGCGGDRDKAKRPLMGAAAAAADRVIVTSDNPRSEDPMQIIADILPGFEATDVEPTIEPDRRAAIAAALDGAQAADVVLIAGKGHEITQTIGDRVEPFDDRVVAAALLNEIAR